MSLRPRLAVLAVLAAGGAAFGGYYLWPSGRQLAACHAPVPAAAQSALTAYAGRIRHDVQSTSNHVRISEGWSDSLEGTSRTVFDDGSGKSKTAIGVIPQRGRQELLWVMYAQKRWTRIRSRELPSTRAANAAADTAQSYRDKIANRRATVVGRALIDGRQTVHIRETIHFPPPRLPGVVGFRFPKGLEQRAPQPVHLDEWLDALTYVPVRTRSRVGGQWSQTDETWLPRTPHTVALAKLTIPHGFKRLSSNGTDSFSIQFSQAVAIRSSCGQS